MMRKQSSLWRRAAIGSSMVVLFVIAAVVVGNALAKPGAKGTIGFAQANVGNGWYEVQIQGVQNEAKKLGYTPRVVEAGGDPVTQNSQVQTFITEHVKAVVLNGTDPRAIKPSIDALRKAKIPFVLVNTPLPKALSKQAYCYVSDNQVYSASEVGAVMAKTLKQKYGSNATVKTLLVEGIPGDLNAVQRHDGWLKGYKSVAGAPKLDLLPSVYGYWSADKALAPTQAVATANPDLKAVFVETDSMMPAVETALKAAGTWNKVVIGSYDGRTEVVSYIKDNPKGPIVATVPNKPYQQGTIAVDLLNKALAGVPKSDVCKSGQWVIKGPPVTAANAKKYFANMHGRAY